MRFPWVIITNRARDRPRYFGLSRCRETHTFVNNVLNHDFMLCSFHQLHYNTKGYSQQERLQWPVISFDDDILLCYLNQFALVIYFDIFNKRVHKAKITIFNIDYNFLAHYSYFLSTKDLYDITKLIFPVHPRSEFVKGKTLSVIII